MEAIRTSKGVNVAELTRLLLQRRITENSSNKSLEWADEGYLSSLLTAGYMAEVKFHGHEIENINAVTNNMMAVARALRASQSEGRCGIWISGLYGNGKSTTMMAIESVFHALTENTKAKANNLHPAFNAKLNVMSAKDLARIYLTDWDTYKRLASERCLGIEDLGNEPAEVMEYGNLIKPMVDLLERRYDGRLFTIVTTNLTPKEVQQRYGERVFDRLREMFGELVVFENESYRKRQK